ncbi:iron-containing redox enzyme family protein [Jatrophihabitans lederbergiae]|uniref:Iron-containing redox enzyme family protein n=1 Tax=Jatrophihabitans lederbergiae TaxID=3075547 RepID=A0ABU2JBB1_9ACTN|nr:iron-containing redox enzyme family protein [Jatrophihabitans sp. DSM 44399]MDT0261939.1 iron-containing redox enzyme family protein [Jatrophihabitans sp. DSM 44399]
MITASDTLTRLYRGLAAVEPTPEDVGLGDAFLDTVIARPIVAGDALDALEGNLRGVAPRFADLGPDEIRVVAAAAARHLAVLADQDGVWLAPFARAPYCHIATGARLGELSHEYRRSPGQEGRFKRMADGLLHVLGQPSGDVGSKAYVQALRLGEAAYVLPDMLLTLSVSPNRYVPELLAAVEPTLTGALLEMPEWVAECVRSAAAGSPGVEWPTLSWKGTEDVTGHVDAALRQFTELGLAPHGAERFAAFGQLLRDAIRLHRAELERSCLNALRTPVLGMINLVERKTPSARRAHGTAVLDGKLLDDLFAASPEKSRDVVEALGKSRWIEPGAPDRSLFVTSLTQIPGPMGKIFSAEDTSIIRRWITWLAEPMQVAPIGAAPVTVPDLDAQPDEPAPSTFTGPQTRELFYDLVAGRERARSLRRAAAFVECWLDAAQVIEKPVFSWELPERYVADEFPEWMHKTYQDMASAPVSPVADDGKSHRDRSFHGAADNLVDGAWLQGLTRRVVLSEAEQLLYDIYWDEIGNGKPGHSHGVMYEDLVTGLGYQLPKFWTRAFIDEVPFLDEGFVAPVFRLAIADFPVSRFPEIVGVNMVCEFHGLGTAGISKADGLTDLGFDTSFTRLHIADDNVEMGHSARSRDAVVFLMAQAARLGVTDEVWERVRRGATAMRMAYVVLMQGRLGIAPTQVPAHLLNASGR